MGSISGRKLNQVLDNLEYILAIELLSASQAIEFRRPLKSSAIIEFAHDHVRSLVPFAEEDRIFANDIARIRQTVTDYSFVQKVNEFAANNRMPLSPDPAFSL
jgi:histidine ammonia-lyase